MIEMQINLEKAAEIMKTSVEEVRKMENIANSMCNCTACPTYRNVFKGKDDDYIAYCFITNGKSMKITNEKQCICPNCPVFARFKLTKTFYCTRGSELQQNLNYVSMV
jgi:hypothetical protein